MMKNEMPNRPWPLADPDRAGCTRKIALRQFLRQRRLLGYPTLAVGGDANTLRKVSGDELASAVDVLEVLIDRFGVDDLPVLTHLLEGVRDLFLIATIRSVSEGGEWSGSDARKARLFKSVARFVDAVDIELEADRVIKEVLPELRSANGDLILSYHNFMETPDIHLLREKVNSAKDLGADMVKIATYINVPSDIGTLTELLIKQPSDDLIIVGMGPLGAPTRVSFPTLGSLLSYAAFGDLVTAPGQIEISTMTRIFREIIPGYCKGGSCDQT